MLNIFLLIHKFKSFETEIFRIQILISKLIFTLFHSACTYFIIFAIAYINFMLYMMNIFIMVSKTRKDTNVEPYKD